MSDADMHEPRRVHSTLPRPWEESPGFHEQLFDWMERAPWMAISAAFHLLLFFVLMAIPWERFRAEKGVAIEARLPPPLVDPFDDVPEPVPRPELVDALVEPVPFDAVDADEPEVDPLPTVSDDLALPLDALATSGILGLGPGAPMYAGRRPGRGRSRAGNATEAAVRAGLEWLRAHQSPDGSWDGDGFDAHCGAIGSDTCDGRGGAAHDVGLTSLALLAFLGDGTTLGAGPYRENLVRGVQWLKREADPESGRIGSPSSRDFVYDHALATLALCEAYHLSGSPQLRPVAQRAVDRIARMRNHYGAWRYDDPPIGDNDTSVTGWMVFALASARDAGLTIDTEALTAALDWFDEVTDPNTGRVGYDAPGTLSSRTPANRHHPADKGEAMTAVALLCRIFLGRTPADDPLLARGALLLRRRPPEWDPDGYGCDMYYWYYGTYATYQLGGEDWKLWSRAMEPAFVRSQRQDGDRRGSWDPVGPWGHVGGRVYATALMTLSLEVYYRYARVLGAR